MLRVQKKGSSVHPCRFQPLRRGLARWCVCKPRGAACSARRQRAPRDHPARPRACVCAWLRVWSCARQTHRQNSRRMGTGGEQQTAEHACAHKGVSEQPLLSLRAVQTLLPSQTKVHAAPLCTNGTPEKDRHEEGPVSKLWPPAWRQHSKPAVQVDRTSMLVRVGLVIVAASPAAGTREQDWLHGQARLGGDPWVWWWWAACMHACLLESVMVWWTALHAWHAGQCCAHAPPAPLAALHPSLLTCSWRPPGS